LANRYINEAAQLSSDNNNFEELASIYSAKSTFELHSLNNIQGAYENLKNATLLFDQFDNPRLKNRIEFELAELNLITRHLDLSKNLFQGIKSRSVGDSDVSTFLEVNIKLAQISIIENDFIEARSLLMREVRAHDMSDLDFSVLILAQTVQAQIAQHFGDPLEADRLYSEAADLVFERSRNTSEAESGYWTVEEDYLYLFEKYADFLLDNELYTDALMLFDRIKTINDATLTENPLVRSSKQSEESLTEIRNLTQEMDRVRREILTSNDDNRLTLQNRLARLSAERQSLTESDQNKLENDPVNIRSIQRQLRDSQTLLHLTEIGQNIFLAVLQRNDLQIKKLPLNNENRQLFEAATESILVGRTELDKLYRIGQLINIDDIASHSNSIIVMPDGFFHQLPLGVIPVQSPLSPYSYGSAQYLIEEAEVRTLNSLKDMTERAVRTDHQFGFSGFGVDDFQNEATSRSLVSLPKAPMEISSINQQLNRLNNNRTFINESATVSQFQQTAGNSKVLHMATHSEVSESDPLFSTLHFYADETENSEQVLTGRLFAYELFDLNLQNDLIMLNSCESGGDRFLQGSGVMGISRALRYAGAKSLVLNSWSVNDQYAAEFAEEFYKHLNNGENKSRALQLTKVHFIKNKNANPHFWGPYILNGDNRPIVNSNKWFAGTLLLALVFLSGLVFTGRRKQQQAA
jgi:CHAT domain-containing protein